MEFFLISLLNGLSYGLILFMLSAGLTLIFSMMGVLNFAHASFYMLGAYFGYTISRVTGFWPALVLAPVATGVLGALFERLALRKVYKHGHVSELLMTFGLSFVILELVQLGWGRLALDFQPPQALQGPTFTLVSHSVHGMSLLWGQAPEGLCRAADAAVSVACSQFPATRGFMVVTALVMLLAVWLLLKRTRIGLVIQAALSHPGMVEALGHDVPRVFMMVFGAGSALAGLAGVIGGSAFLTEPTMAAALGPVIFVVVVVGGLGSLAGAFLASLLIGVMQVFAVTLDHSLGSVLGQLGVSLSPAAQDHALIKLSVSQFAPVLPYVLLVLMLALRPKGLLGKRDVGH